jgi:hypothetical protein
VEDAAQGEEVAARVRLPALELLGRHVLEGAEDGAHRGERRRQLLGRELAELGAARLRPARGVEFRQAEIEQLDAALGEEDVAGLEVAVDDPGRVRALERVGDLDPEPEDLLDRERPPLDALGERLALEELHDQEVDLALPPDVVEGADVRVLERRDRLRLALEALAHLLGGREVLGQDLERDRPVEPGVLGAVDLAHPAGAERGDDFVGTEARARRKSHWRATLQQPPCARARRRVQPPTAVPKLPASPRRSVTPLGAKSTVPPKRSRIRSSPLPSISASGPRATACLARGREWARERYRSPPVPRLPLAGVAPGGEPVLQPPGAAGRWSVFRCSTSSPILRST